MNHIPHMAPFIGQIMGELFGWLTKIFTIHHHFLCNIWVECFHSPPRSTYVQSHSKDISEIVHAYTQSFILLLTNLYNFITINHILEHFENKEMSTTLSNDVLNGLVWHHNLRSCYTLVTLMYAVLQACAPFNNETKRKMRKRRECRCRLSTNDEP